MLPQTATGGFFWVLVRRDLQVRYAGSTLGALWNLIHPLMLIAIYMTIFSQVMRAKLSATAAGAVDYGDIGYGVHLCAGLIPWLLFSDVLTRSVGVLIDNGNFLKKISFPPVVLFTSVLFNGLLIHGAGYLTFLGILVLLGHAPPPAALAGLGLMLLLGLSAMGLGLILAGLNVFFRDTAQVVSVVMQLLFWFNPIVYVKEQLFDPAKPTAGLTWLERTGRTLLFYNPFERFITANQSFFGLTRVGPGGLDWIVIALFPALCLLAGLLLFRRILPDVRDCL
jgi:lipopolysaccharide transport system permease protein